ncbi:MAG: hypothetical protein IJR33_08640 [Clostridia bacterium]|nr:hypothetical protein [Clostridia bacterium]
MKFEKHITLEATAEELKAIAKSQRVGGLVGALQNVLYGAEEEIEEDEEEDSE